jgi:hypothetical protein
MPWVRARARIFARRRSALDGIIHNSGPKAANSATMMMSQVNDLLR